MASNITTKTFCRVSNSDDVTQGCFSTLLTMPRPSLTRSGIRPQAFPNREINYELPRESRNTSPSNNYSLACGWGRIYLWLRDEPNVHCTFMLHLICTATSKWNLPKMARKHSHFHNDVIVSLPSYSCPCRWSGINARLGWLTKWLCLPRLHGKMIE